MIAIFRSLAQIAAAILDLIIEIGRALHFSLLIAIYGLIVFPAYFLGIVVYFVSIGIADQIKRGSGKGNFYPEQEGLKPFEYYLNLGNYGDYRDNIDKPIASNNPKKETLNIEEVGRKIETVEDVNIVVARKFFLEHFGGLTSEFGLKGKVSLNYTGKNNEKLVVAYNIDEEEEDRFFDYMDVAIMNHEAIKSFEAIGISMVVMINEKGKFFEEMTVQELKKKIY